MVAVPPGQRVFNTLPSVDSAVESWDGSTVDSVLNHAGTYSQTCYYYIIILSGLLGRTVDRSSALSPGYHSYSFNEWRSPKTNNIQSSTAPRQRNNPLSDLGLSDDDWDRPPLTG